MKSKLIIGVILGFALHSCALLTEDGETIQIIDNYYVGWNDLVSNRAILKKESKDSQYSKVIVESYVFAVGHNENFIIAKQRSPNSMLKTKYFIVDINQIILKNDKTVFGPLSKEQFEQKKAELGLNELNFDLVYEEYPNK
jgi:hypothetical protein